jgi:anti-sigma factor RsiW
MSCEWQEKIGLYVDEELAPATQQEVSAHLTGCRECAAAVAEQLALKKAVRVAGNKFTAPPELHAAIYRQLHPGKDRSSWWKWVAAVTALTALALAVLLVLPKPAQNEPMLAGLVDQHITALASSHPVDVISEDRHTVKPWFQGKLAFTFTPPELAGTSYKLIGGKQVFVQQKPGAQLFYAAGAHKISVFIFQAKDGVAHAPSWGRSQSFNSCAWSQGGLTFYLVTDATREEASRLVSLFQQANKG